MMTRCNHSTLPRRPSRRCGRASSPSPSSWNPTRSRGAGADDLVVAFGGLWVGSDNKNAAIQCGREYHPGICFLPY